MLELLAVIWLLSQLIGLALGLIMGVGIVLAVIIDVIRTERRYN